MELVLNATRDNQAALTAERLFGWHAALFPTGYSGLARINVGGWRDDADVVEHDGVGVGGPLLTQRIAEVPGGARVGAGIRSGNGSHDLTVRRPLR